MRYILNSNHDWLNGLELGSIDHERTRRLLEIEKQLLDGATDILTARRARGCVRTCHGDMHLANLVLLNSVPTPFDAIEFNDWIGTIDVLYDLAFPIMDFFHRGRSSYGNLLWNRYLDHLGSDDGLGVMSLFIAFRATVRALVEGTSDKPRIAESYLTLAEKALKKPEPSLVAIGGLSGSGKSCVGQELAPALGRMPGARLIRTDVVRKRLWGQGLSLTLPEAGYSPTMTKKTYAAFYDECRSVLKMGVSVITDGVFANPEERQKIERIAKDLGVPFVGMWLDAPMEIRKDRVLNRLNDVSDATPAVLDRQMEFDIGDMSWITIDASGPKEASIQAAIEVIRKNVVDVG